MKTIHILFACVGLFIVSACDSNTTNESDDLLVVEAFLFAGEKVDDIRIKQTIPFGSADSTSTPVNDAVVALIKEGSRYVLTVSGENGYYEYAGDDLDVEAGDVFELNVQHKDAQITAFTTVPGPPQNVELSGEELSVPNFDIGFGGGGNFDSLSEFFSVTWDNPAEDYHYVVVSSDDPENPDFILPDFVRNFIGDFEIISEPTTANFHEIIPITLSWLGPHFVTVYQVNEEYADLYENREQDSRDLTEPPSNVVGGLGVFTAFNGVVKQFEVVRDGE